jgi:hypothetical protein
MRKVQFGRVIIIAFLLSLILASCYPIKIAGNPKPEIYIIQLDTFLHFDGRKMYVLEYSVNGSFQSPAFNSREEAAEYQKYLGQIGNIYKGETVDEDSKE